MTSAVWGIVVRDWSRSWRQPSRLIAGIARPFLWLLLVGSGYNAIARVQGAESYQAFVLPGIIVMAMFFGSMLTAIATVYDREFGMLRVMLASPGGVPALLMGRAVAATLMGVLQGGVVLLTMPLFTHVTPRQLLAASLAVLVGAAASSVLGLLVAARLRSVENFAGVINVVLFPLLFLSGALYPTAHLPALLRGAARLNPVTYAVDLTRAALGQGAEFSAMRSLTVLGVTIVAGFVVTAFAFDPEQRFVGRPRATRAS